MGRCCFVPNCKSGYKSSKEKVSLFKAPFGVISEWKRKLPRSDREFSEKDFVCEKHFHQSCILRAYNDGIIEYPLKVPRLAEGSIPTIFPNCPAYLTTREVPKRRLINRKENLSNKRVKNSSVVCNNPTSGEATNQWEDIAEIVSKGVFSEVWENSQINYPNENWSCHKISTSSKNTLSISKMFISATSNIPKIEKHIVLEENGTSMFLVHNKAIRNERLNLLPESAVSELEDVIKIFDSMDICAGGPKTSLYLPGNTQSKCAVPDMNLGIWRHKQCPILLEEADIRICTFCTTLKNTMRVYKKRQRQNNIINVNGPWRTTAITKLRNIRNQQRKKLLRLKKSHSKIRKELATIKEKMKSISTENLKKKLCDLNLPAPQKLMIEECIQICKLSKKNSRRYTGDWLILCLLLHIRSPAAYRFLQNNQILPLPSVATVRRYLSMVNMKCGLDDQFFEALRIKLANKIINQRHGLLVFDEMQVRKSVQINAKSMTYCGVVDFGNANTAKSTIELADHALVFMFTSLADNYSQPIAVYAAKGPTKGTILAGLITQVIIKLESVGALVDGIICDGATTNRRMWKEFGISGTYENVSNKCVHPVDETRSLYFFSDTPHLFKCIRNRLQSKSYLRVPEGIIAWKHYQIVYREDMKLPGNLKVCPKISHNHIYPSHMLKMRVKLATQIFSNGMTEGLTFYKNRNVRELQDADVTIKTTKRLNDMFDALNRKIPVEGIRKGSKDLLVMQESLDWLNLWEKRRIDKLINNDEFLTASTAEGLRVTLTSSIELVEYLLEKCDFRYVLTAKINQDCLERFFGTIRQAGCSNDHPSFVTFIQLYRMLGIYKLIKPPKFGNCSVETTTAPNITVITLDDFKRIFRESNSNKKHIIELKTKLDGLVKTGEECEDVLECDNTPEVVECVLYYVVGYLCLKLNKTTTCSVCKSGLVIQETPFSNNSAAVLTNQKTRGYLTHPNSIIFNILKKAEEIFLKYVTSVNVYEETITEVINQVPIRFPCEIHKLEMISHVLHYFVAMRMRQYFKAEEMKCKPNTKEKRKLSKLQET